MSDLDEILKQYQKPIEAQQVQGVSGVTTSTPSTPPPVSSPSLSVGLKEPENKNDPRYYYQSGVKKGQLRPKPKLTAQPPQPAQPAGITGEIISGVLFLTLIDMLFPMLIAGLNNIASKDKIKYEHLQLTDKQKKELEPVANEVAKRIALTGNPIVLMCIAMGGIYGLNFAMLKMNSKK